jgi:hypothetical protein
LDFWGFGDFIFFGVYGFYALWGFKNTMWLCLIFSRFEESLMFYELGI